MKKTVGFLLALTLCAGLILPALNARSADGDVLREAVVARATAIAEIEFAVQEYNGRDDIKGDLFKEYSAGGVRPSSYFGYHRSNAPYRGMPVTNNPGSLDYFKSLLDTQNTPAPGIGSFPGAIPTGFNIHSFLTDVVSKVSPSAPTDFKSALGHKSLVPLLSGADLSAVSSVKAVSDMDALKTAYAKLGRGDLLLAWDDKAKVGSATARDRDVHPPFHVMVVKEIKDGQVTVIYPSFSQTFWKFKCDKCGYIDFVGPTYKACPEHIITNKYYSFKGYYMHRETYPEKTSCTGKWTPLYATTWRTETFSYEDLAGSGVPYAGKCYLPYTLAVYGSGAPAAEVKVTTDANDGNIYGGFTAKITSNYRIIAVEAVLSGSGATRRFNTVLSDWKAWTVDYSDPALDQALLETAGGRYHLALNVKTGAPTDRNAKDGYLEVWSRDFGLSGAGISLKTDKTVVVQGTDVTATLTANRGGYTAVKTAVSYDPNYFAFDAERSRGNGVTLTDDRVGEVAVRYAGNALGAGDQFATLVFTARRTGSLPVTKDVIPIRMLNLSVSDVPGAADEQLSAERAEGTGAVSVGFNAVTYKDYVQGTDLVVAFVRDVALVEHSEAAVTYNGRTVYEVTRANYSLDGDRYYCAFACFANNADPTLMTLDTGENAVLCPEVKYSADVNLSGTVDIADAQTIVNIYKGRLPLEGNEQKWFRADLNRDGRVDAADRDALIRLLSR